MLFAVSISTKAVFQNLFGAHFDIFARRMPQPTPFRRDGIFHYELRKTSQSERLHLPFFLMTTLTAKSLFLGSLSPKKTYSHHHDQA